LNSAQYGAIATYDKAYDRVNTKQEKVLQQVDRERDNVTTSDDPILTNLAAEAPREGEQRVFATDSIIGVLMTAPRSVYPWDIVITRTGDKVVFDTREGSQLDYVSVNENSSDPPMDNGDKDSINSPAALSLEATYINTNFAAQVVNSEQVVELENSNPFYGADEESVPLVGYRYRKFDLSTNEDEDISLIIRTEVDAVVKSAQGEESYITVKALNEFDTRAQGAGGAMEWRQKLDSQRGAVVATEMKNNSCKLARWVVQSMLAGADHLKLGYVSFYFRFIMDFIAIDVLFRFPFLHWQLIF
jgi:translation initiation factor 3 subunit D